MGYKFYTCDVFTEKRFSGNALAVLPRAEGLTDLQMQMIAREFNLSETAFVLPPLSLEHTRRVRIFTPEQEVPFAGHPTVGCAFVLAVTGEIGLTGERTTIVLEENVGAVPVSIRSQGGKPVFMQLTAAKPPEFGPAPPPVEAVAKMLSVDPSDIMTGADELQAVSCGLPFLFVPLKSKSAVARSRMRVDVWEEVLAGYWAQLPYVFSYETEKDSADVHARMYAAPFGTIEDPATGAAATALGAYLASRDDTEEGTLSWVVEQGCEMGRPSTLEIEAVKEGGAIASLRVGGGCVMVSEGDIEVVP